MSRSGQKHDDGKIDWTLLPWVELEQVALVMMHGMKKYNRDNWKKVKNARQRYRAALLRHVTAYEKGFVIDGESNLHHLAHAVCCCLFLMFFDRVEKDNG